VTPDGTLGDLVRVQVRVSKESVGYTDTHQGNDSCGRCKYFHEPHLCRKVTGWVQAEGWCRLFEVK